MRRRKWKNIRLRKVDIDSIDSRLLIINLYITQALIFVIAALLLWFNRIPVHELFSPLPHAGATVVTYGILCAAFVLLCDYALARFVPDSAMDDGGLNRKLFEDRALWHVAVICLVVAFCEELLFRGAVQHLIGAYWTSVLFAAIHVRYLRHWLMTLLVFVISYALGWIYMQTGTLLTPMIAHFMIDFVLGVYIRAGKIDG